MKRKRYVVQVSFTIKEHKRLIPLISKLQEHSGMNKSQLIKRLICIASSELAMANKLNSYEYHSR